MIQIGTQSKILACQVGVKYFKNSSGKVGSRFCRRADIRIINTSEAGNRKCCLPDSYVPKKN